MAEITETDFSSPFEAFLRDPLCSLDASTRADILRFITKHQTRLSELDHSIAQMSFRDDSHFERIQKQRRDTHEFIGRHKAILSIKRRVPVEIWRYIFELCLPHVWGVDFTAKHPREEFGPWAIAAVCVQWRSIVLGTSELWATFKTGPTPYDPSKIDRRPVAFSIERARGWPLCLTVDNGISYFPDRVAGLIPWEQVRTLKIHHSPANFQSIRFDVYKLLTLCTDLRTVDICHGVYHEDCYFKFPLVLPQLRRMSVAYTDTMLANLRAPALLEFAVTVDSDFYERSRRSIVKFLRHSGGD